MGDEWEQNPQPEPGTGQPNQDEIDKRLEEIKRTVTQGANEAQQRIKRVIDKAGGYWQQAQTIPTPRQASNEEEQRIRQLANMWSSENWRIARELGNYMDLISWSVDEVWEVTLQTRWETRTMETMTEPYTGRPLGKAQPLLPVWDYELPVVTGLKGPTSHTQLEGLDEVVACTNCNGTGRALCATCAGRGWYVCPECRGRTKKRCSTCRGRGYVADWVQTEKKPFFKKQAENIASSVNERVADVFDGIRQSGVPIPNPMDTDPANKGKTVPCPDCVNGEVDCTCGNGKRICETCQGAKSSFCVNCAGTGKVVRHREIARHFELRVQTRIIGNSPIPERRLTSAGGELVYNAEVNEPLYPEAPSQGVPMDVWRATISLVESESTNQDVTGTRADTAQGGTRPTLQVLELVRIPYTRVDYHYGDQDYAFYAYDGAGQEKFYADRYPARWDRIERLVRAISNDLVTPSQQENVPPTNPGSGYRVPIEFPPYTITEDDENI
ncbi:MAG: zinc finger-like domain-containing protein [Ktedonobacteraceae bacterium]